MRKFVVLLGFLLLLSAPAVSAASTVAYSNVGDVDIYENWGTWVGTMQNTGLPNVYTNTDAVRFTASATGTLSNLALGMAHIIGNNALTLSLRSDAGGTVGSTLWTETFHYAFPAYGSFYYLDGLDGPMLSAGTTYWLQASADSETMLGWHGNVSRISSVLGRDSGSGWEYWDTAEYSTPYSWALRVEVESGAAPVPEPGTMVLLGSGLAMAAGWSRKRFRR